MKMRVGSFLFSLLLLCGVSNGEVIFDLVDGGVDSGWSVVLADNVHNGVVVDRVTETYVRIEIAKTFYLGLAGGQFPANLISFQQRLDDAHTVPTIEITSESVTNGTGSDWTDYHWRVLGDAAAFDADATDSSGFSIEPFTNRQWGGVPSGPSWSSHALWLDVDGGIVSDGETFFPGSTSGKLYIDVDLSGEDDVEFTIQQNPTPEPGTTALLCGGAVVLLAGARRRKRKLA